MKRYLSLLMAALVLLTVGACSSDSDSKALLENVPGSAQGVFVINLRSMLEKSGSSINGDKVELSSTLQKIIDAENGGNGAELLTSGAVRPTSMVVFLQDDVTFLTGFIGDEAKFRSLCEKMYDGSFSRQDGLEVCGEAVITDGRFWLVSRKSAIADVAEYMKLKESSSFASREVADMLCSGDNDISLLFSLKEANRAMRIRAVDASQLAALAAMADEATYVMATVRFEKGRIEADMETLNSHYERSKFDTKDYPVIDMKTVERLEGNFEYLLAISVKGSMLEKMSSAMMEQGDFSMVFNAIRNLDGTVALGVNPRNMQGSGLPQAMLVAQANSGDAAKDLGETIKTLGSTAVKVSVNGKTLLVRTSVMEGRLNVGGHLDDIKGSYMGAVMSGNALNTLLPGTTIPFDGATLALRPDDGSLKLELRVYSSSDANTLATMMRVLAAMTKRG